MPARETTPGIKS